MALEIERKYLLKNLPKKDANQILHIEQYYCEDKRNKHNFRLRKITHLGSSFTTGTMSGYKVIKVEYVQTVKRRLKPGIYEEHEITLNKGAFDNLMMYAKRQIRKKRYIYKINKTLKWEVDVMEDMKIILAEIEIPKMSFKFKIPKYIQDELIMEVTKFDKFTNKALSFKI